MAGLDGLLAGNTEALNGLPIEERAMIPGALPHELRIKDIAALAYPDNKGKQEALIEALVDLCKAGRLQYYGDINGWSYREDMLNPFPKVKGGLPMGFIIDLDTPQMLYAYKDDCLIHRDNFKSYLLSVKQWPVKGLLANWWTDSEPQAEALRDDGAGSQINTKPMEIKDDTQLKRTRTDNLKRAFNAARKDFDKKPSFEQLWKYFQDDKDTTGFIEDTTDDKITWRDTKGKFHDVPKTTLANRLSRLYN